mgnify:CR=1 FL=1
MSLGRDVSVRVVLKGIDQASPTIRKVVRSFKSLRSSAQLVSKEFLNVARSAQMMGRITSPIQLSEGAMRKLRREANKVAVTMPRTNKQFRVFGVTLRTLSAGIQSVIGGLIGFSILQRIGGWLEESVGKFAEFEKSMRVLAVVSREAGQDIRTLASRYMDAASEAADRFALSIMETSRALDSLVRAGLSGEEAMKALNSTLEIAISEGVDAAHVADIMASTLAQFALSAEDAERVADALTNAAAIGVSTMTEYANGLSYCGAVSRQLGLTLEETLSALVMVDASIKDATKSGRYLQAMLSAMAEKSKDLGFAIYDANGKMLGFGEIIKRLYKHLKTFGSEQERNAYLFKIFGEQGARAVAAIITYLDRMIKSGKNLDQAWDDLLGTISKTGTAGEVAEEALDTTAGSIAKMNRAIEKAGISLTRLFAPAIAAACEGIADFTDGLINAGRVASGLPAKLDPAIQKMRELRVEGYTLGEKVMMIWPGMAHVVHSTASVFEDRATAMEGKLRELGEMLGWFAEVNRQVSETSALSYENLGNRVIDVSQKVLDAGQDWNTAFRAWSQNLYEARKRADEFAESMRGGAGAARKQADALDIVREKLKELADKYRSISEGLGGVGAVAGIGESFIELRKSFREEKVAPKIRELQEEIDELTKRLEEVRENTRMNKSIRETQIEALQKEIEERRRQIEELRKSVDYTAVEAETLQNLGIIQKTISFQTQVMSLYQRGLQLAMMGATEAGQGMMQAALDLASALEDGIVTDEEKKKILEELGVTFDETGNPVLNLKDIMKSFQDQIKENISTINDLMKTMKDLDGLESHIYIYRHEITVGGGGGATMEELGATTLRGHQTGLWKVPYNNYIARLHRGEMVLPRNVAEWFRRGGFAPRNIVVNVNVNANVSSDRDVDELARVISRKIVSNLRVMT